MIVFFGELRRMLCDKNSNIKIQHLIVRYLAVLLESCPAEKYRSPTKKAMIANLELTSPSKSSHQLACYVFPLSGACSQDASGLHNGISTHWRKASQNAYEVQFFLCFQLKQQLLVIVCFSQLNNTSKCMFLFWTPIQKTCSKVMFYLSQAESTSKMQRVFYCCNLNTHKMYCVCTYFSNFTQYINSMFFSCATKQQYKTYCYFGPQVKNDIK